MTSADPTMEAINDAVTLGRSGDRIAARITLGAIWHAVGPSGDALHRCALAHYMADLQEDAAQALAPLAGKLATVLFAIGLLNASCFGAITVKDVLTEMEKPGHGVSRAAC